MMRILVQLVMTALVLLFVLSFALTIYTSANYFIDDTAYQEFFGDRDPTAHRYWPALLHIFAAIIALLSGPLQFWRNLRENIPRLHRAIGRIYVTAVLFSSSAAIGIAPFTLGGPLNGLGLTLLAVLWTVTTMAAIWSISSGRVGAHRGWMILSYGLALAGVSLRFQIGILVGTLGLSFETAYAIVPWSSWIPNLLVCGLWICLRPTPTRTASSH